jgi:hypothetical protein
MTMPPKISWKYCLRYGFDTHFVQRTPSQDVQNRICNGIRRMVSYRLSAEYSVVYAFYIQKEQIAGPKNDHTTRKSPGNILWVRALLLILCKEHPPKLYKNEFSTKSDKWCLKGWL